MDAARAVVERWSASHRVLDCRDMDNQETSLNLLEHLYSYQPHDERERAYLEKTISFLQSCRNPFSRNTPAGHITVSAVLVDNRLEHLLLLWHKKLERWLQPGGHCEPGVDDTLVDAALRELEEETGVQPAQVEQLLSGPFDVDVHEIPARGTEAAHLHYDLRYLFRESQDSGLEIVFDREESGGYAWRRVAELCREEDSSISRYARKIAATTVDTQGAPALVVLRRRIE
jgi:8-oxo-dGTP pyrophosphatase MutT (NUDIX family)